MDLESALHLLMLTELPGVGEHTADRICRAARRDEVSIEEILRSPPLALAQRFGLAPAAIDRLTRDGCQHENHCRQMLTRLAAAGIALDCPGEADYPPGWERYLEPKPPASYRYGNTAVLHAPTLAILNSRDVSERTVTASVEIVRHGTAEGITFVTGGMKASHRIPAAAVRACGAPRVIVLDRGLFANFGDRLDRDPFGMGPARSPLDSHRTLVISAFRPDDHAAPRNGRRRDELIAALADVIVAATARPGGEIERVCLAALDRGQCVLCWHGTNGALLAAGAAAIDERDLRDGLRRFVGN